MSVALIEKLQRTPQLRHIHLVCYENDPQIIELLRANLQWVCQHSTLRVDYEIREDNYILSQLLEYNGMIGAEPNPLKYDMVIGNPPYMKIAKVAQAAKSMPEIIHGSPNRSFFSAVMGLLDCCLSGESVFIILSF